MSDVYKVCSCGLEFVTLDDFLKSTRKIGVVPTLHFMEEDLELRNCSSCLTSLSRKIPKKQKEKVA
ncbi:MAG: hypothetical protein KC646_09735 [Candidatus Cloacimonetes bacterium]|nr:hypothetical protein [Candidatus Cloacimonadota bacterium]